jgi:hypothetical protein
LIYCFWSGEHSPEIYEKKANIRQKNKIKKKNKIKTVMDNEQKQFRTIESEKKNNNSIHRVHVHFLTFYKEWKLLALCRQKMHGEIKDAV